MKLKTYFSKNLNDNHFLLEEQELSHISVMREEVGSLINIVCDDDFIYLSKIVEISKKFARCEIVEKTKCGANPSKRLTAFVCIMKQDKNEFLAEKLVELGVSRIVFVESRFMSRLGKININRIEKIVVSATKQCGRSLLVKVSTCKLSEIDVENFDEFVLAYECEKSAKLKLNSTCENCAFLIGSEGGLDVDEVSLLVQKGAKTFSLGQRILRAETAGIVVATLCQKQMNELN